MISLTKPWAKYRPRSDSVDTRSSELSLGRDAGAWQWQLNAYQTRIDDLKKIVFPHPTVSEIIRETIFEF